MPHISRLAFVLTRVRSCRYEQLASELMADTPTEHPSSAAVHALVRTVSELQGAVDAANGEGRRRRGLRSVVAKFRAGEAEEILEVAGRELRHEGVVLKGNKARRRPRPALARARPCRRSRRAADDTTETSGFAEPFA